MYKEQRERKDEKQKQATIFFKNHIDFIYLDLKAYRG